MSSMMTFVPSGASTCLLGAEGEDVKAALSLAVDAGPADLIDLGLDRAADVLGVLSEDVGPQATLG